MARVYLARDVKHDRPVALKVLRPELAAILGRDRFLREVQLTARLSHPHILPLLDSGEAGGFLYHTMPYVEGESLRWRLERAGRLSLAEAAGITGAVAAALDYAHGHGVIHRDIKPENILLHEGEAMVADFGIALAVEAAGGERLTGTGLSLGTPGYMSPEQILGERELDGRADVYSLGCVIHEMLAGQPPFTGMALGARRHPPRLRDVRRDAPPPAPAGWRTALRWAWRPRILVPALVLVLGFGSAIAWARIASARRAEARALVAGIATLADQGQFGAAYDLALRAEQALGADTALARLWPGSGC
jgi:serine/threonine-protein kinase